MATYKIKVVPVQRPGKPSGFKVHINGKKYPAAHGYWFVTVSEPVAVIWAMEEYNGLYCQPAQRVSS